MHLRRSKESDSREHRGDDASRADRTSPEVVEERWSRIKTRFVDDPEGALDDAVALVDDALDDLVHQVRSRCAHLRGGDDKHQSTTEEMRQRLHECRIMLDELTAHPLLH